MWKRVGARAGGKMVRILGCRHWQRPNHINASASHTPGSMEDSRSLLQLKEDSNSIGVGVKLQEATKAYAFNVQPFGWQIPSHSGQPRRRYSTKPDPTDAIFMEGFDGPGPGDTNKLLEDIEAAANELKKECNIADLKFEFERDFRPVFSSNCLIVPYDLSHIRTAFLHGQTHGFTKLKCLHVTSLDFMLRVKTMKELQRKPLIDFFIKRRVLIHEDWHKTYGNIEILEYQYEESNSNYVRAECDASFKAFRAAGGAAASGVSSQVGGGAASGALVKMGVAKLAMLIWKGKQLLWAEIFDGVLCKNNHHAEVLAALALLKKCETMKFSEVKLWSDSERAIGVINGSESIQINDVNRDTYLLLRSMHTKFTTLIAVHKCRELMFLADQVIKLHGISNCIVEDAIKMHSPYLRGCPLFSVTHNITTNKMIGTFDAKLGQKKKQNYIHSLESTYFCKVKKDHKFQELERLKSALLPGSTELVVDSRKIFLHLFKSKLGVCLASHAEFLRPPFLFNIRPL